MDKPITIMPDKANANWSADTLLDKWGCPYDLESLRVSLPHFTKSGNGLFELPDQETVLQTAKKRDSGKNAHIVRLLLAHLVLYSTYSYRVRSETITSLEANDPVRHPVSLEEWVEFRSLQWEVEKFREKWFNFE